MRPNSYDTVGRLGRGRLQVERFPLVLPLQRGRALAISSGDRQRRSGCLSSTPHNVGNGMYTFVPGMIV